jgi:hypothetical protein
MESLGEFLIRGVVECDWVWLPTTASCEGEQVGDEIGFPFDMLSCQAVIVVKQDL